MTQVDRNQLAALQFKQNHDFFFNVDKGIWVDKITMILF